jgi:hypothetical protein
VVVETKVEEEIKEDRVVEEIKVGAIPAEENNPTSNFYIHACILRAFLF